MPIYEYECDKCLKTCEKMENINAAKFHPCECNNGIMHRIMSHTNFKLNGVGWSADGYENKPPFEPNYD